MAMNMENEAKGEVTSHREVRKKVILCYMK